jgi:hypothetical protein
MQTLYTDERIFTQPVFQCRSGLIVRRFLLLLNGSANFREITAQTLEYPPE